MDLSQPAQSLWADAFRRLARNKAAVWAFAILMLAIQMTNFVMPTPEAPTEVAIVAFSSYLIFAVAAWFVEKQWG